MSICGASSESEVMSDPWVEMSWEPFVASPSQKDNAWPLAWHKHLVPYVPNANALQTLDIWVPAGTKNTEVPEAGHMPSAEGTWVVYVHGGAWRDPKIDATSFKPTVAHLLSNQSLARKVAGLASINYSLSPYPDHQTNPSPPRDPKQPTDPSRMAMHPKHINDLMHALRFLQEKSKFGGNYILVGHSCGATLSLQVAMDHTRWANLEATSTIRYPQKPYHILGLNGLYDLPGLVHNPGAKHNHLVSSYQAFIELAFGNTEESWGRASPSDTKDWGLEWPSAVKVVLGQSKEDSLVPYRQTRNILERLRETGAPTLEVVEVNLVGDHDDIWRTGFRLSELIGNILIHK